MIRVGRRVYQSDGKFTDPNIEGFKSIVVMTSGYGKYSTLSPYSLTDENGCIMENVWQFSKVYESVPKSIQRYSRYSNQIIWNHPAEIHVDRDGNLTNEYLAWREKGFYNPFPVRYPVGYHNRHKCICSLKTPYSPQLDYIESRKEIYLPLYSYGVRKEPLFHELKKMLDNGTNLLIIEVDGPHQESLGYYKKKYHVDNDFIVNNTMLANETNLDIMLNDPKHPFGHGYCLAHELIQ
jgi:hypothetical protein